MHRGVGKQVGQVELSYVGGHQAERLHSEAFKPVICRVSVGRKRLDHPVVVKCVCVCVCLSSLYRGV